MRASDIVRLFARILLITALVSALSSILPAQEATGRIFGVVYDPSGAVVPGVHVVVTNAATHITRDTTTDNIGYYQVLSLPVGSYTVSVDHKGFKAVATSANNLDINQSLRIDVQLAVGSTNEVVTVETTASTVETIVPTLAATVSNRTVQDLPLNGRNSLDLALLQRTAALALR